MFGIVVNSSRRMRRMRSTSDSDKIIISTGGDRSNSVLIGITYVDVQVV